MKYTIISYLPVNRLNSLNGYFRVNKETLFRYSHPDVYTQVHKISTNDQLSIDYNLLLVEFDNYLKLPRNKSHKLDKNIINLNLTNREISLEHNNLLIGVVMYQDGLENIMKMLPFDNYKYNGTYSTMINFDYYHNVNGDIIDVMLRIPDQSKSHADSLKLLILLQDVTSTHQHINPMDSVWSLFDFIKLYLFLVTRFHPFTSQSIIEIFDNISPKNKYIKSLKI